MGDVPCNMSARHACLDTDKVVNVSGRHDNPFADLWDADGNHHYFDFTVGLLIPCAICMLGLCGNFVSLFVLSLDRGRCPTFYSLRALALSDIVLLLSGMLQQVIPMFYEITGCDLYFCPVKGYVRVYSWPVICTAQMSSMWLTVLISAERNLAVCFPFQSAHLRTIPRVRCGIITIMVGAILYNVPRFFEFRTIELFSPEINMTVVVVDDAELRHDVIYRYLYNTALYCLVLYAIPLIILSFLNVKIIFQMKKANSHWETLNRKQQKELRATVMPLCVVIVFIVCSTQSLIAFVLDAIFVGSNRRWLQVYFAVVNLLVLLNSAVNFLIFYLFGRKFRMLLGRVKRGMFCKGRLLSRSGWQNRAIQSDL